MGATQDRWDRYFEERDRELDEAHDAGKHTEDPDPDCGGCFRAARENREGDPAFNGAFDKW